MAFALSTNSLCSLKASSSKNVLHRLTSVGTGLRPVGTQRKSNRNSVVMAVNTQNVPESFDSEATLSRRFAMIGAATVAAALNQEQVLARPANEAGDGAQVEAYLPETEDGFYSYVVKKDRTPALRSEVLEPYSFVLPATWKEQPVVNAISGNYCQPRCDEPTTEVKFGSNSQGNIQVIIAPLTKLTRLPNQTIDQIGDLEGVINSIGPYITGDFVEPEYIVSMEDFNDDNGRKYYLYELDSPFALTGQHTLACVTTSKNALVMLLVSASEKQWTKAEPQLRRVANSLRL